MLSGEHLFHDGSNISRIIYPSVVGTVDSAFEDVGDDASGVRPGLLSPVDQSLRRPLGMFAVTFGHVLGLGGVAAFVRRAQMAGHPLVGVETLDGLSG